MHGGLIWEAMAQMPNNCVMTKSAAQFLHRIIESSEHRTDRADSSDRHVPDWIVLAILHLICIKKKQQQQEEEQLRHDPHGAEGAGDDPSPGCAQ